MSLVWDNDKNEKLKKSRNVSFEQVQDEIRNGRILSIEKNPSRENQMIIVVKINDYPCVVPFVVSKDGDWYLKTIYQSRKMKRRFGNE